MKNYLFYWYLFFIVSVAYDVSAHAIPDLRKIHSLKELELRDFVLGNG